jgi:hypothetical protein
MGIIINAGVLILSITISYFFSPQVGIIIDRYLPLGSSWIDLTAWVGFLYIYIFILPLFYQIFWLRSRYYWLIIFWVPIASFVFYTGASIIYLPILVSVAGFALGYIIHKFWPTVLRVLRK